MPVSPLPIAFAGNPLDRASNHRADPTWVERNLTAETNLLIPFYKGDPLIIDNEAGFLAIAAKSEFPADALIVFLGIDEEQRALFALDASGSNARAEHAPFGDIGAYTNLRNISGKIDNASLAILGQARWLLDWHQRHQFCSMCGAASFPSDGGTKRTCTSCKADHFPRTDPVAIVLVQHEDHCLLGRGPHFPPGFLSCLAGFAEPGETIEECAAREIYEEAGLIVNNICYKFSQPWPFPSSMMMGMFADAEKRDLTLDTKEIEEAQWLSRDTISSILNGDKTSEIFLPPRFTIARQLLDAWITI